MQHFTRDAIGALEQRYRAALINSLTGFKSANLVGTVSPEGQTNLAIFSQVFHIGADPALVGLLVRPDAAPRHTLQNIEATGAFTLNHILPQFAKQAHQTSARYPADVSEFAAVGLTEWYSGNVPAPYVAESVVKMGLALAQRIDLTINNTILLIGSIQEVFVPADCLLPDGFVDLEKARTVTSSGLDSYHVTQRLYRLGYAKPDRAPAEIAL